MVGDLVFWGVTLAILALNVPFGYWRAGLRKFSLLWFVAIHAPIPAAIALRMAAGIPFRLSTLPVFVAVYFAGQWLGAWLRKSPVAYRADRSSNSTR
jgi:hypothetical protein